MTCIVGLVSGNEIIMGADSAATDGWGFVTILKSPKIFEKDGMLIGVTGHIRMMQILRYSLALPEHPEHMNDEEYMSTRFVDAVRETLKNAGYAKKESEQERVDSNLIVGYHGTLFEVESNYQIVIPDREYHAVGSGSAWALGTMYATPERKPSERVVAALEAAETFSNGVRGPFILRSLVSTGHQTYDHKVVMLHREHVSA